ncbi:carboxymuconolactone decarboxylase family protein [Reyranella sp.]|uniref:carboxymuconolactone decarboxylase family protein n=1 Tax=Reyranella sp. TaxID=1929291 RepID=UPI002F92A574
MSKRLSLPQVAAEGYAALRAVEAYIQRSNLPPLLIDLVKMRGSQINGCAYCLDMHSRDSRKQGETEQRLYLLDAWRESPLYTPAERAALAWTEALTLIAETRAPDADYEALTKHFTDKEIADLTILVGMINLWNRIAIGLRAEHPVARAEAVHERA